MRRSASDRGPDPRDRGGDFRVALDALAPPGLIALAVSGGPDSLALLLLAQDARPGGVIAATVDHRLRPESAGEAARVAAWCAARAIPHAILPVSVEAGRVGLQAAARAARYAALARWAEAAGAVALATAHHLDDQAETLLMRLARGSGIAGLAGIRAARPLAGTSLRLVRPLLSWRKAELAAVIDAAGLVPVDDPANRDPRHDRTAFRALLAREPLLAPARLAAAAAALADAEAALEWSLQACAAERMRAVGDATIIDAAGLPRELRRRLLALALPGGRGDAIARLLARLEDGGVGTIAGKRVMADGERWTISDAPPRRTR